MSVLPLFTYRGLVREGSLSPSTKFSVHIFPSGVRVPRFPALTVIYARDAETPPKYITLSFGVRTFRRLDFSVAVGYRVRRRIRERLPDDTDVRHSDNILPVPGFLFADHPKHQTIGRNQ